MKINTITYSKQINKGSYDSQSVEITITLEDFEDRDMVLDWVKARVDNELGITHKRKIEDIEKLEARKDNLSHEIKELEADIEHAKERWEKAKSFMELHGIPVRDGDSIPF